MKTTQATRKIKMIKSKYLTSYLIFIILFMLLTLSILFIYLSSQYFDLPYSSWVLTNLWFIYVPSNEKLQLIINIASGALICLLNVVFILIIYYVNNAKYQKKYIEAFFDELKLNEIYFLEKRSSNTNLIIENVIKTCKLTKSSFDPIFSIKSIFDYNFTQVYSKNKKSNGLIITSETDKSINGYLEIRFNDDMVIDEFDNKNLYQFVFHTPSKYPYPLFVNTNLGIVTNPLFNEKLIRKIYDLKKFTKTNFTIGIYNNKMFIYIDKWELKIQDSLRKKLRYNSIDKKIDSFTKLIDDLQDLYICIIRNYEVIKYGK